MVIGGLIAGATNMLLMAGDPISLNLLAEGKQTDAGIAAAARAVGFIPLVASTAIATGVYSPVGFTLIFVVVFFSPNVWLAVIIGEKNPTTKIRVNPPGLYTPVAIAVLATSGMKPTALAAAAIPAS